MTETSTPAPPQVAILGGGVIGGTILAGLRTGGWPSSAVAVADRNHARLAELRDTYGVTTSTSLTEVLEGAEAVVLAVKPQDAAEALDAIKDAYPEGALLLTVAAGLPGSFYAERLPAGTPIVRAMPNTPAVVAQGATAVAAGPGATQEHLALAAGMLRATGLVVRVDEDQMNAVGAVSGSGPAYFFAVVEALTDAGVAEGLDRTLASQLAMQTFVGAANLLMRSGETPQQLRANVSSKGGSTLAALEAMSNAGLQGVISAGVAAAVRRNKEMGEELG